MTETELRALAARFAAALDANDFEAATALLAPDCRYESPDGPLVGSTRIVESYRSHDARRALFDHVAYESEIVAVSDASATIRFIDLLEKSGQRHVYSCHQEIAVNEAGLICRIAHREIPGERDAALAFYRRVGLTRE